MFGAGSNGTNTINTNTITSAGANLPIYSIYSAGTANNTVSVLSNNIQDYFKSDANSSGINVLHGQ
jgi:hypothetical protein